MIKNETHEIMIPTISTDFFCIVNRDNIVLSAVISSYITDVDSYLPMFEFSRVTAPSKEIDIELDEDSLSRNRAKVFNVKIKNVLKRIKKPQYMILGGLTDEQKSYLTFLKDYDVLEIDTVDEATHILGAITNKNEKLVCRPDDVAAGLCAAQQKGLVLAIDENAANVSYEKIKSDVIVVIENIEKAATIIAINYAKAIKAHVLLIPEPSLNVREIKFKIEEWQGGNKNALYDLGASLYKPLEDTEFGDYKYATFFTIGAPYGFILGNMLPVSHVHLRLNPDFFIFNCIHFEKEEKTNSAIVFSPSHFKDEETDHIISLFEKQYYHVKELVGKDASVYQISNHIKEFPFDILHICSHGGEASGYSVVKTFVDRYGGSHIVEFDEVVSFAPSHNEKLVPVTIKKLWRKFDGLVWGSKALKDIGYRHEIFVDMLKAMDDVKKDERTRKDVVPNSCAIKCADFYYQGIFDSIAAMRSPFVFNNTCWSWIDIADSFLAGGSRAYIGTLWKVDNVVAKQVAEEFYSNAFDKTIIQALYNSLASTKGNENENIFMLWGLHFSTIGIDNEIKDVKLKVASRLLISLEEWKKMKNKSGHRSDQIQSFIVWIADQLTTYYMDESRKLVKLLKFPGQ
ncbi:hypothetical protein ACR78G_20130 [Sphingobacterium spiritivorum]|uniref:hypothetical protein n=1 Tax=Sphingobacterium spiritivorum TaxID=258 RepID=UPI003DA58F74